MAELTFLGTSGSVVTKERMCAGLLFQDKLIDIGFGVLANLVRSGTPLESINDLYVSHTHSDHIGDFTGLVWAMAMERRTKPLRVVSSAHTATVLASILELQATPREWVKFSVDFVRPEEVGADSVKTLHDPETLAYRFRADGCDFVYGADTAKSEKLEEFSKGSGLLIHEATFLKDQASIASLTKHSTAEDAALTAESAGVGRLVLTHISPPNSHSDGEYIVEARRFFGGNVVVARDNLRIKL